MAGDDDIAARLPEPPPPAPSRRQAAIGEAMRRYDAAHGGQPVSEPPAATPAREPWWTRLGRPQAAALVTAGLVALFGVPAAWLSVGQRSVPAEQTRLASANSVTAGQAAPERRAESASGPAALAPPAPMPSPSVMPMPAQPADAAGSIVAEAEARHEEAPPASPPPIALARAEPAAPAELRAPMILAKQGYAARADKVERLPAAPPPPAAMAPPPPPPPVMVASAEATMTASANLAATAAKRAAPSENGAAAAGNILLADRSRAARAKSSDGLVLAGKPAPGTFRDSLALGGNRPTSTMAGSGDWNACTIDDPARSLRNCRRLIDPAAAGPNGRAAAHIADGLSRAWEGDLDGAIAKFDQAIAISPRNAMAWLNRGLALQRKGEFNRAGADLDRAVRLAPDAARVYYNRSLLLRQRGEADRAEADADRAVALDPDYVAVVK